MNKEEKLQFIRDLQKGKVKLADLMTIDFTQMEISQVKRLESTLRKREDEGIALSPEEEQFIENLPRTLAI